MNCTESQQLIIDMAWQDKPPVTDYSLSMHISGCVKCQLFYEQYSKDVIKIVSRKRSEVDTRLFDSVITKVNKSNKQETQAILMRPVFKIAYSALIGTAAIFTGILVGQFYFGSKHTIEKESYSKEIAILNDMSTVNAKIIEYYESDNPE